MYKNAIFEHYFALLANFFHRLAATPL